VASLRNMQHDPSAQDEWHEKTIRAFQVGGARRFVRPSRNIPRSQTSCAVPAFRNDQQHGCILARQVIRRRTCGSQFGELCWTLGTLQRRGVHRMHSADESVPQQYHEQRFQTPSSRTPHYDDLSAGRRVHADRVPLHWKAPNRNAGARVCAFWTKINRT